MDLFIEVDDVHDSMIPLDAGKVMIGLMWSSGRDRCISEHTCHSCGYMRR